MHFLDIARQFLHNGVLKIDFSKNLPELISRIIFKRSSNVYKQPLLLFFLSPLPNYFKKSISQNYPKYMGPQNFLILLEVADLNQSSERGTQFGVNTAFGNNAVRAVRTRYAKRRQHRQGPRTPRIMGSFKNCVLTKKNSLFSY